MTDGIDEGLDVLLRPARETDAGRWLQMLDDPDSRRYASPAFIDVPGDEDALIPRIAASADDWLEGRPGTLSIAAADEPDHFLGTISWRWTTGEQLGVAELGYAVHPDARGRGVGRQAIVLLTRWLLARDGRSWRRH